jgi:hypothetical protein
MPRKGFEEIQCRGINTRQKDWSEREWARDLRRPDDHSRLERMRDEHGFYQQPRSRRRGRGR